MEAPGTRIHPGRVLRDAGLFMLVAVGALGMPFAKGLATGPKNVPNAQDDTDRLEATVGRRASTIRAELKTQPQPAWAGDYYRGDGLGANVRLVLARKSGVAATWHGCLGLYGANMGPVVEAPDGALDFQFERPNREHFGGFPDRVIPIRWGERRYLLTPSNIGDFVAAINHGEEPRPQSWGPFFLADGDDVKHVSGLPPLPAEYQERIRKTPVRARVLTVEPTRDEPFSDQMCDKRYRLKVEVSDRELLRLDEDLEVEEPEQVFGDFFVLETHPGRAVVIAKILEINCAKPEYVPTRRWVLTTGAYDSVAANEAIDQIAVRRAGR